MVLAVFQPQVESETVYSRQTLLDVSQSEFPVIQSQSASDEQEAPIVPGVAHWPALEHIKECRQGCVALHGAFSVPGMVHTSFAHRRPCWHW
jgi:hypothetical protein